MKDSDASNSDATTHGFSNTLAMYTSFALGSALLIYTSLHVLLDAEVIAASYPVHGEVSNDNDYDDRDVSADGILRNAFRTILASLFRYFNHLMFLIKISLRIAGTLVLLVACAVLLLALSNRFLIDVATSRADTTMAFSYKTDPAMQMTTLYAATEQGLSLLLAVVMCHTITMVISLVFMRPGNMNHLEKEIAPKLRMYLTTLFIVTFLTIASEAIRIAMHE